MALLTVKHLIKKNYPIDHNLTEDDRTALLKENEDGDFSFLCIMKEMFHYPILTVDDLFRGWGSVKIVDPKL